ncbi:MAG: S-layer homology domain-containing protein [Oscillospiraceae bacterium]|nr:S-layer homology domain-containing protein [Oscillospiraceae bacterium]
MFWDLTPIMRPFDVTLSQGDPLTFIGNGAFTPVAAIQENGASYRAVTKYTGDKVTVAINTSKTLPNYSKPVAKFQALYLMPPSGSSLPQKLIKSVSGGAETISFDFTNSFIKSNLGYITYTQETSGTAKGRRGHFTIKPVYQYIDQTVRVFSDGDTSRDNRGYLQDLNSRTSYNVVNSSYNDYYFHYGDKLNLHTVMNASAAAEYDPTGVSYLTRDSSSGSAKIHEYKFFTNKATNPSNFNVEVALDSPFTELRPLFSQKNNAVTIRVKNSDVRDLLDTGYGFFANARQVVVPPPVTGSASTQTDFIVSEGGKVVNNQLFTVAARLKEGKSGGLKWVDPHTKETFSGNVFFFHAGLTAESNIIELSVDQSSVKPKYYALSGFLFHDARNLLSELKSSPRYPAVGGVINAGASIGLATSGGGFETAPFMALPGTRLRYQIAVDGMNRIAELNIDALASGVAPIRKTITTMVNANTTKSRDEMVTVLNVGVITANAENTQTARFIRSGLYVGNVESHTGSIPLPAAEQIDALPIGIVYVTVADKVQYQMYNSNGTESTATETIQGVNFLICDGENQTLVKKSIPGERDPSDPNRWFVSLEGIREDGAEGYQHGDKVYVQMVTDRRAGELAPDPESAMREPSPELRAIMNRSVYAPVFTGCELHISTVLTPVNQNFNMPNIAESTYSYEPIPLIGKLNFTTTIKSMSFSVQQLADGVTTRLSFGKVRQRKEGDNANTSKNYGNPVSGTDYSKNGFLASLKQKLGEAKNMLTDPGSNQELMGFGAPQWSVAPTVGFFLDFTLRTVTTEDGNTDTRPMLAGGGIFLGIAAGFRLTYYVVVPVVFIPVYFGVEGFFNAMMDMGFTAKTDVSQTDIARREINFGDELDFGSEFIMNASVFLYAGIGINKLLSIKGGFELDADLLIDQEYIGKTEADSPGGFAFSASLKIGIDVFLLTIPFSYKVVDLRFGSFSQSNNTRFMSYPAASPPMTAENLQVNVRSFEGNPSDWTPMTITPYAGFVQSGETTLQKNGYDNPEPQILAFGENDYLMVFLGRDQDGTTTLFYSVYNGYDPYLPEADRWSEPLPVSPGLIGGDFEPHIVDAGGKILITWMNGDGPLTDLASYTGSMEIYAALFDKISRTVGPAERLTDDSMVDYSPRGVYDPMTGDMVVYYLKTLPQGGSAAEFVATMDSTANDCSLCYMLYDGARGEWARDMYFPNEIADPLAAAELIKSFGGQRFVLSPIPGYADPLIVDFAAVEHGGFAAYAFTVDMDNNKSTVEDRELYLQLYEFASHKTYLPFRVFGFLAEGETIQYESLPQFASNGSETYLFWVENENNLLYLDIGGLLSRDGETGELLLIDINGQPRTTDDEGSPINAIFPGTVELYEADGSSVRSQGVESTNSVPIGSYVPQVSPKGDLYVIWNAIDTEGWTYDTEDEYSVELYATALIKTELLAEVRPEEGVEEPVTEPGPVEVGASSWAPINQLTFNGHHNRDHVFAVSERGDMMVIHNKFLQTYTDDVNNPVAIRDLSLAATVFHPDSSIEVRDIAFSNTYPAPGETITVTANLINYGLTAARDYRAEFYGFGPGTVDQGVLVHTYDPEDPEPLLPGQSVPVSFSLSVPLDNIAGYIVMGYGSEYVDGWIDDWDARGHSEPLMQEARYEVRDVVHTQRDSSLLATLTVENTGNIPGSGLDVLYAEFRGPYMSWKEYGLSEDELEYASEAVGVLAPGESREITLELLIPPQGFEFFGFMDISYTVRDNARQSTTVENEGLTVSEEVVERFHLDAPFAITLNIGDGMVTNTIPARVGNTYALSAEYWPVGPFNSGEVLFGTDDPSIAHVRDGKLVAVANGSTNLNVVIAPYGLHADFPITVTGVSTPPPPVNPPYTPDIGGTLPALTVSVNGGAVSVAYSRSGSDVKLTLPESKLNEIIRSSANGLAVFNLAAQTNAKSVSFDVNTAQKLSAANVSATLRLPAGELTLSPDALASLAGTERLGVTPVTVEISKAESLTKLQEARVRDYNAPVSIAVFVGNIKSDVQGSVSLPYTLKEGADPRAVSVWSLSASGRLTRLTGAYSGGMVTFTTSEERLYTAGIDPVALWDNIFIDISPTDWFYDAVAYANYYGYVDGDNSSRYKPFDTFSRATFATLIWKLEGKPNGHWAKDKGQFIDVPVGLWYSDAVCWAAEQGIVTGTGNGFNPSKLISRQEMVTMLYNYLTYKGVSIPDYQDARYTGADAWAAEAVNALGAAGVLNNIIDGNTLEPERNAIRAELAQLFKDYLTLIAE